MFEKIKGVILFKTKIGPEVYVHVYDNPHFCYFYDNIILKED